MRLSGVSCFQLLGIHFRGVSTTHSKGFLSVGHQTHSGSQGIQSPHNESRGTWRTAVGLPCSLGSPSLIGKGWKGTCPASPFSADHSMASFGKEGDTGAIGSHQCHHLRFPDEAGGALTAATCRAWAAFPLVFSTFFCSLKVVQAQI